MKRPSGLDYITHADLFAMFVGQANHRSNGVLSVSGEMFKTEEVNTSIARKLFYLL